MFTVYCDMFRLTRVIFRLELFVCNVTVLILGSQTFTCFYIDIIYCIIIVGCNNVIVMVLMLIITDTITITLLNLQL